MYYFEVLVATPQKINFCLLYSFTQKIKKYQIVRIPLRQKHHLGIILKEVKIHDIDKNLKNKCLSIDEVSCYILPESLVKSTLDLLQISAVSHSEIARLLLGNTHFKPLKKITDSKTTSLKTQKPPLLNNQQQLIYDKIIRQKDSRPQLLLGINSSGKTRLYAQLAQWKVQQGYSVLILVPEIGLSTQVLLLLQGYLKFPLHHFHSKLTPRQKRLIWQECFDNKPMIIVGPRSAEFLPLANLGLIILDEFHDDSFKQDNQPIYQTLQMASLLAKNSLAQLICGSATPKIEDYYHFLKAKYPIHYLSKKALKTTTPIVTVVDKKQHPQIFSPLALKRILSSLKAGHQVLVFYNRRGHWQIVKCQDCFWQALCQRCQRGLIFYQDKFKLLCHGCGFTQRPLSVCPRCQQAVVYNHPGLKTIKQELEKYLLNANLKIPLWDFDSANLKQDSLVAKLEEIQSLGSLVILGTQVISQGLDLPNLQTVVILNADQSLISPDFRTQERYYRHIHQLSGRVGRGHLSKTYVVLQTYQPNDLVLQYALKQDYMAFYEYELKQRQEYQLPPFTHLANIIIRHTNRTMVKTKALLIQQQLSHRFQQLKIYPPAPALKEKRVRYWEWLICVKAKHRKDLIALTQFIKENKDYFINLDPNNLFDNGY